MKFIIGIIENFVRLNNKIHCKKKKFRQYARDVIELKTITAIDNILSIAVIILISLIITKQYTWVTYSTTVVDFKVLFSTLVLRIFFELCTKK